MFGNIGGPQLLVILLVALVVLGPEKLPEAVRAAGKMFRQVRNVSAGFQKEMRDAMDMVDMNAESPSAKKDSGLHPGLGSGPALPPLTEVTGADTAAVESPTANGAAIEVASGEDSGNGAVTTGGAATGGALAAATTEQVSSGSATNGSSNGAAVSGESPGANGSSTTQTHDVADDTPDGNWHVDGPPSSFS